MPGAQGFVWLTTSARDGPAAATTGYRQPDRTGPHPPRGCTWVFAPLFKPFELGGVLAVALDIRATARELRQYDRRPLVLRPGTAGMRIRASGVGVLVGGEPPTIEERVASLERQAEQVTESLETLRDEVQRDMRAEMEDVASRMTLDAKDRYEALDKLLRGVTKGGIRLRVVGIVLVVVGIVATMVGSLVSPAT
jgi:hypothetical protein